MQKSKIPDAKLSSSILERDIGNGERKPTNMFPSFFSNQEPHCPSSSHHYRFKTPFTVGFWPDSGIPAVMGVDITATS